MVNAATPSIAPKRRKRATILAHPEDLHCVLYHLFVLAGYAAAFWIWLQPERAGITNVWETIAFVLAAGFLLGWASGVDVGVNFHNHAHRSCFRSSFLGRWFGRIWTFSGGWPSYFWWHSHIVVHHSNLLTDKDWTVAKHDGRGNFENLYKYCVLHWPWRYVVELWKDFTQNRYGNADGKKALKELLIFAALYSIPFWIDPLMGLALWVFPHWVANCVTMASGMYVQHEGSVPKSKEKPFSHSNCFTSKFFNLTMFNIGYHIEHHDNPTVHWSALPRLHDRLKPKYVEAGAHVVPYGYYKAANLLAKIGPGHQTAVDVWRAQHPDYVKPEAPQPASNAARAAGVGSAASQG